MLNFRKDLEYALLCLTAMARERGRRFAASMISREHGLSPSLISKILQKLNRANLISSSAGVTGGYELAREPHEITIHQVASALNEDLHMTDCGSKGGCNRSESCLIKPTMSTIQANIWRILESTTLEAFLNNRVESIAG